MCFLSLIVKKVRLALSFFFTKRVTALFCLMTLILGVCSIASAADTTAAVTTLSGLQKNLDTTFSFGLKMLVDIATISGLGLFFLGIFSVYGSHTKQASGGKPMSHGLVMIACGAVLIGLPYFFKIASTAVIGGSHQIGSTSGLTSFISE